MEKLFAALGLSSKNIIGISVSSANFIEIAVVDKKTKTITKYARKELSYNNAIREIINYDDFAETVKELFKEINIQPKGAHVVLNMPNVHFAFTSLPAMIPDDQLTTSIASEVDNIYLFKRNEPVISCNIVSTNTETDKKYIAYSAIQENTIQNIKSIFEDLEVDLVAVENVNSSIIKGILYSNVLENELTSYSNTNILLLNTNSMSILCFQDKKIVDYYEEPLAIKSYSEEEVYGVIANAATAAIENYPCQNLLIISENDEISAEMLSHKMKIDGTLKYLDRNIFSDSVFMNASPNILPKYLPLISLEVVGAAIYSYDTFPLKFNFLTDSENELSSLITIPIMGVDYEIERKSVYSIGGVIIAIFLFVAFVLYFSIMLYEKKLYKDITTLEDKYVEYTAKVNAEKITGNGDDVFTVIKKYSDFNKNELEVFKGLGSEIPSNVYLTYFFSKSDGVMKIEGVASSNDAIYAFVKGLKSKYQNIIISKLQLGFGEGTSNATTYSFTIESEIAKQREAEAAAAKNPQQNQNNTNNNNNNNNNVSDIPSGDGLLNNNPIPDSLPEPEIP